MTKINISIGLLIFGLIGFSSCSKVEGPGGNSSIKGNLKGVVALGGGEAEQEVTHIICPPTTNPTAGAIIVDGEYFLLNTPNNGTYYYVWFDWVGGAGNDPALQGRTGIPVSFSYPQSNVTVANNTATAISTIAGIDYSVSVQNDVITVTCNSTGEVPDAEDMSNSNFDIDVANQGKSAGGSFFTSEGPIANERVYIIYGEEDTYSETVRSDANGDYQFKGLTKGNYRMFAFSTDTITGGLEQIEVEAEITKNKEVVEAAALVIIN